MVDEEAFVLLDEETLKEMVNAVGQLVKLLKKLREMQVLLWYSKFNTVSLGMNMPGYICYKCDHVVSVNARRLIWH